MAASTLRLYQGSGLRTACLRAVVGAGLVVSAAQVRAEPDDVVSRPYGVLLFQSDQISRPATTVNAESDATSRPIGLNGVGRDVIARPVAIANSESDVIARHVTAENYQKDTLARATAVVNYQSDTNARPIALVNCPPTMVGTPGCPDCNGNGILDICDADCSLFGGVCSVAGCGMSADCNGNDNPDECDIADCAGGPACNDCNQNGVPDGCDLVGNDCNHNGIPDDCDAANCGGNPGCGDCNGNGVADELDLIAAIAFAIDSSLEAGDAPYAAALGDLNADGDADLVVVNASSANCSLFLNDGGGTFTSAGPLAVGTSPRGICISDFDNNGLPDLAVTSLVTDSVQVLQNQGGGSFLLLNSFAAGDSPYGIASGYINDDGLPDLVVGKALTTSDTVHVLINQGGGSFADPVPVNIGDGVTSNLMPRRVVLADVDGNGRPDLVTANATPGGVGSVSVLRNSGGAFAPAEMYPVGTFPYDIAAEDWDGDGHIDLAVINTLSNNLTILTNDGTGSFAASGPALATGLGPRSIRTIDMDDDGLKDLLVANWSGDSISLFRNLGDGGFVAHDTVQLAAGSGPHGLAVGDFDADEWPDFAVANRTFGTCQIFLNESAATSQDCNNNGTPDECDINCAGLPDVDQNGVPDECETPDVCLTCPGDISGDQEINGGDIQGFVDCSLGVGTPSGCGCADMDTDGSLTDTDITFLVTRLLDGSPCP